MKKIDVAIIGSGQSGNPLAADFAEKGYQVYLFEKNKLGGSCVNYGCTPTKAYVASARRAFVANQKSALGVEINGTINIDLQKIRDRAKSISQKSIDSIQNSIDTHENLHLVKGHASFIENHIITCNGEQYKADQIFIDTGSRAVVPERYANIEYLTNKTILELTTIPKHLIIIGGSYIGLEFGQIFRRFGSEVSIIEKNERIISKEDKDISEAIQSFLEDEGIRFYLNAKVNLVTQIDTNAINLDVNGEILEGSHLLIAVGRQPNSDTLNLENTNIKTDECGYVNVNDFCQTNVSGIFAMGDVNGKGAFTHTSYNDYEIVKDYLFGNKSKKIADRIPTYALFTDPPLGRVGKTEQDARKKSQEVEIVKLEMAKVSRAIEMGETNGLMKLVVDKNSNKILGAAILGIKGDEVIAGITNLMYADASVDVLKNSVHIHPTVSELLPSMIKKLNN